MEYLEACTKYGVKKPHPEVARLLQKNSEVLDLSRTYVGNKGILALLEAIKDTPGPVCICLRGQNIYNTDLCEGTVKGNEMLSKLVEVASKHPSLTAIDLSSNPLSNLAGRMLLDLANTNKNITQLDLDTTYLDPVLEKQIQNTLSANSANKLKEANGNDDEHSDDDPFTCVKTVHIQDRRVTDVEANTMKKMGMTKGPRKTVVACRVHEDDDYEPPVIEKSPEEIETLQGILRKHVLFSHLTTDVIDRCIMAMSKIEFEQGDEPCVQGIEGDSLVIMLSGEAEVLKNDTVVATKDPVNDMIFGELELMYNHPCVATIRITTPTALTMSMDREDYQVLVQSYAIKRRNLHLEYIKNVKFIGSLSQSDMVQLADALETDEWEAGEMIISYGQTGKYMYIVIEGEVQVLGRRDDEVFEVCTFSEGDNFGELEFLNNHKCVADVKAVTRCKTAKISKEDFEHCLGPIRDHLQKTTEGSDYAYYRGSDKV